MKRIIPADPGAFAVLIPVVYGGKLVSVFPSPVIAFQLSNDGECIGIVTPLEVHKPGVAALWTPDGVVESGDDVWGSMGEYFKHLQKTLLH